MSSRVALIEHPRQTSWVHMNDVANTPLSSSLMTGYVAASLEAAGHTVEVADGNLEGLAGEEIVARVAGAAPEAIGLHLVYDWSDGAHVRALVDAILDEVGPVPVLAYGFYPTFAFRDLPARFPGLTGVVVGEPEVTMVEAVGALAGAGADLGARAAALARVPGAAAFSAGAVVAGAPRPLVADLDTLPPPRRTPEMLSLREVNIAASRGCYGACTFCTINPFYGHGSHWRPRSPAKVLAEMAAVLESNPHKRRFYFVDPNFFGPRGRGRERVLELARSIEERFDIRFGLEGRVNDIDEEVVEALVRAGFDEILIGLESGSDATLDRLNKHTSVAQNRRALRILRSFGVEPNVGFIMFEPDSSLSDVRVNLGFLEEEGLLDRLSVTANVLYHQQIMLAGTPAFLTALLEGRLVPSAHNPYQGHIPYRHPEVAFLAETMAEACRHLFAGLPWEAWPDGPARGPADERTAGLNAHLVDTFRGLLEGLERGSLRPDAAVAREVVEGVRLAVAAASA